MMEPFPAEVDYNNISIKHVMLKEEQKRLRGHVERGAFSQGLPNPLEGELYLATKSKSQQQPMSNQNTLNSPNSNATNNSMNDTSQNGQYQSESLNAQNSVQKDRPRIHPSRFSLSKNLDSFIRNEEGYEPTLYRDTADNPTIGIGHKVVNGEYKEGDTISREQAEKHFAEDKEVARAYALNLVGDLPMHRYEFEAIVDAMYNVGSGNLGLGTNKSPNLNDAIKAGNYTGKNGISSNLIYSKDSNGRSIEGLYKRSRRRTNMFNGNY